MLRHLNLAVLLKRCILPDRRLHPAELLLHVRERIGPRPLMLRGVATNRWCDVRRRYPVPEDLRDGSLVSVAPIVNTLHEDEPAIFVEFENSAPFSTAETVEPRAFRLELFDVDRGRCRILSEGRECITNRIGVARRKLRERLLRASRVDDEPGQASDRRLYGALVDDKVAPANLCARCFDLRENIVFQRPRRLRVFQSLDERVLRGLYVLHF